MFETKESSKVEMSGVKCGFSPSPSSSPDLKFASVRLSSTSSTPPSIHEPTPPLTPLSKGEDSTLMSPVLHKEDSRVYSHSPLGIENDQHLSIVTNHDVGRNNNSPIDHGVSDSSTDGPNVTHTSNCSDIIDRDSLKESEDCIESKTIFSNNTSESGTIQTQCKNNPLSGSKLETDTSDDFPDCVTEKKDDDLSKADDGKMIFCHDDENPIHSVTDNNGDDDVKEGKKSVRKIRNKFNAKNKNSDIIPNLRVHFNLSPTSLTNFSIAAILKPDFGVKKMRMDIDPREVEHNTPNHHQENFPQFPLLPHHLHHQNCINTINGNNSSCLNSRLQLLQQKHLHSGHCHSQFQQLSSFTPVDLSTKTRHLNKTSESQQEDRLSFRSSSISKSEYNVNEKLSTKNIHGANPGHKNVNSSSVGLKEKVEKDVTSDNSSVKVQQECLDKKNLWPAWVFCTRYSDRPSSGPRSRKLKRREKVAEEKRPRTAFTSEQLSRLKKEFEDCRYLTENRRRHLASELGLSEAQIKIWFQNKRAKIKKSTGVRNPLALQLMAQGLYNHSTVKVCDLDMSDSRMDSEDGL